MAQLLANGDSFGFGDDEHSKPTNRWDRFHSCHLEDLYKENDHSDAYYHGNYYRALPWMNNEEEDLSRELSDSKRPPYFENNHQEIAPASGEVITRRNPISFTIRPPYHQEANQEEKLKAGEEVSTKDKLEIGMDVEKPSHQSQEGGSKKNRRFEGENPDFLGLGKSHKSNRPRVMSEMVKTSKKPLSKLPKIKTFRKMKFNSDLKMHKRKQNYKTVFSEDSYKGSGK